MARIYWQRKHSFPATGTDDVRVVLEKDWDAPPLERSESHDLGWHYVVVDDDDADDMKDADISDQLGLCGSLTDVWLIYDAMCAWGAIMLASGITPNNPVDPVYGCPWRPSQINDGGADDFPSPAYAQLQAACAMIWDEVAPGVLSRS